MKKWEHKVVLLSELGVVGADGWEAVGVVQFPAQNVVIVKRPEQEAVEVRRLAGRQKKP